MVVRRPRPAPGPSPPSPLVALTTDVGWTYASQMKAVILREVPSARIVDITHEVMSHQVMEGAFLLRYCGAWLPPGTIHLAVVDPGVGGDRLPIAISCRGGTTLVGPDNGLLVPLAEYLGEPKAYRLLRERVVPGTTVSATFEGRDLFAPAAARIALGAKPSDLGQETGYMPFQFPTPYMDAVTASLAVLHVDHFGNVITNVPSAEFFNKVANLGSYVSIRTHVHSYRAQVVRTYEELPHGTLGLVASSFGLMELTVNRGRAKDVLGLAPGARFVIQRIS